MTQPKQLVFTDLVPKDEFHPGGVLCKIIDNDGSTVLKEWWDINRVTAVLQCRNYLKIKFEGGIDFSVYEELFKPDTKNIDSSVMNLSGVDTLTL